MTDLSNLIKEVIDAIKNSEEYIRYHELLDEIKKDPELFNRIKELRQKNYELQKASPDEAMDFLDALTNEYEDVINLELVSDLINAEAAYYYLVRGFNMDVVEGLDFK